MGIFEQFPYTNYQNFNIDWVLKTIKELKTALDGDFTAYIEKWVMENYNQLFFNAAYNSGTDTLTMSLAESIAATAGGEPVSYIDLAGQVLEIVDKNARASTQSNTESLDVITPKVNALHKTGVDLSRVVIIGDSFAAGKGVSTSSAFPAVFYDICGGEGQTFALSGVGFVHTQNGMTAEQYFNSIKPKVDNPATVTAVIVDIGWNDRDENAATVNTNANSFWQNVRAFFPAANFYYMPNPGITAVTRGIVSTLIIAALSNHVQVLESQYWMLLQESLFQSDHVHPNEEGHARIANMLWSEICGHHPRNTAYLSLGNNVNLYAIEDTAYIYASATLTQARTTLAQFPTWLFGGSNNTYPNIYYHGPLTGVAGSNNKFAWLEWGPTSRDIVAVAAQNGGTLSTGLVRWTVTYPFDFLFG